MGSVVSDRQAMLGRVRKRRFSEAVAASCLTWEVCRQRREPLRIQTSLTPTHGAEHAHVSCCLTTTHSPSRLPASCSAPPLISSASFSFSLSALRWPRTSCRPRVSLGDEWQHAMVHSPPRRGPGYHMFGSDARQCG